MDFARLHYVCLYLSFAFVTVDEKSVCYFYSFVLVALYLFIRKEGTRNVSSTGKLVTCCAAGVVFFSSAMVELSWISNVRRTYATLGCVSREGNGTVPATALCRGFGELV